MKRSTLSEAMARRDSQVFDNHFYKLLEKCKSFPPKHRFRFNTPCIPSIPHPVAGTLMEGCTNYDCTMFEGIGIEYDRELTKAMFPPRAIDFNDDMKNNGSGISYIIYRANYFENNLELKISGYLHQGSHP
jgi:hypothetical protein